MDQEPQAGDSACEVQTEDSRALDTASLPFVGRWNQLISNTNWEKGGIIHQWREALRHSGAPSTEYSDEAWGRRVGGVTGQHVGRLRRVFQRFATLRADFETLHWSHFQAATDWDDAEMWLEGAVQNGWSVSRMRSQRWETLGKLEDDQPQDADIVTSELDEDFEPGEEPGSEQGTTRPRGDGHAGPRDEGPDFGEDPHAADKRMNAEPHDSAEADEHAQETVEFVRPFAKLTELPSDLSEALEAFKLAILHHKMEDWQQIARDDVLASLDALKQLVMAPSPGHAPF
ncbi:MAG: hypothetical protein ACYC6N_20495 [Pirellulaceae bacterium]